MLVGLVLPDLLEAQSFPARTRTGNSSSGQAGKDVAGWDEEGNSLGSWGFHLLLSYAKGKPHLINSLPLLESLALIPSPALWALGTMQTPHNDQLQS